jgi:hypothetical protein
MPCALSQPVLLRTSTLLSRCTAAVRIWVETHPQRRRGQSLAPDWTPFFLCQLFCSCFLLLKAYGQDCEGAIQAGHVIGHFSVGA